MDIAIDIDISSNALNKNTQFNTIKIPQMSVLPTSFLSHFSVLCPPVISHMLPKKSVAQMHLMNTSSTAGIPVCIVKNPMEPKIAMEIVSLIIAAIFNILPPLVNLTHQIK